MSSGYDNIVTLNVNELNLEQINPNTQNFNNPSLVASKIPVLPLVIVLMIELVFNIPCVDEVIVPLLVILMVPVVS